MIHIQNKQNIFLNRKIVLGSLNDIIKKIYEQNLFFIISLFLGFLLPLYSGGWSPEVLIINGTTGKQGSVDSLKLIAISTGMQPIGELNGFSGSTKINNINIPEESPILFQAKYKGATYKKMVPPAPIFRSKPVEITVYETLTDISSLDVKSVIQITRESNSLRFLKVYIFNNTLSPPKSYVPDNSLEIFIPESAENIRGQYTQADSKMGIPLSLEKGVMGRKFDRAVLPGQSDLMISYDIRANPEEVIKIEDKILFEKENSKIFLLNPPEMKLRIEGVSQTDQLIEKGPEGMMGVKLSYINKSATIEIRGGKPIEREVAQERRVVNGTIFVNWINSTYGVLAIVGVLFSLSFLFVFNQR
jgi:hypothetical protein